MSNDVHDINNMTLAIEIPRAVRLRLGALQLKCAHKSAKTPTLKALVLEAINDLLAKHGHPEVAR